MQQNPITAEITLAATAIGLGIAKLMEVLHHAGTWLVNEESTLASISYIAATLAAVITIYYKIKNHGK